VPVVIENAVPVAIVPAVVALTSVSSYSYNTVPSYIDAMTPSTG
jgi:hypothetical protein